MADDCGKGRITEECNEMVKDKNDDVVMYYWTELTKNPALKFFVLFFCHVSLLFQHVFRLHVIVIG